MMSEQSISPNRLNAFSQAYMALCLEHGVRLTAVPGLRFLADTQAFAIQVGLQPEELTPQMRQAIEQQLDQEQRARPMAEARRNGA